MNFAVEMSSPVPSRFQWVDHERGRDGTRLEAAWYGEGRRIKQRGLEVATEMAKVG